METKPGEYSVDTLKKTAILGTSHIIRKVLQCETGCINGGDHRWFRRSASKRRPVTRNNKKNIIIIIIIIITDSNSDFFLLPMPPHVLKNFRGFPPGCGDSVADF